MSNGMVQLVLGGLWNQPALLPELLCILGADGCVVTTTVEACGRAVAWFRKCSTGSSQQIFQECKACGRAVAWFRKCSTGSSQQIFQECTVGSSSDLSVLLAAYHSK